MPWRPRAPPSPPLPPPSPRPGFGLRLLPEPSVPTTTSPRPAAAFSLGRRAGRPLSVRSPYPWRRRRGLGRGRPGPRQQLPSGARRPPRRLPPGPPRPTALPAAGGRPGGPAAPRVGGGPRGLQAAGEKPALARPPRVQPDRKEKEEEREGDLACEEPEARPRSDHRPLTRGLRQGAGAAFPRGASHVQTFSSTRRRGSSDTPDRFPSGLTRS